MKALDLIIIFGYLIGIVLFGTWFGRKQKTTSDYFLGDRAVPWWAVAFSIVATETSTITFISVPGIAFARAGNFQFLQLVFGYLLGRVVISILFSRRVVDGLSAPRSTLRRQDQDAGRIAVRRDAQHRRWYSAVADGDRARGCLHLISTGRERGSDHHRLDRVDRRGNDHLHV